MNGKSRRKNSGQDGRTMMIPTSSGDNRSMKPGKDRLIWSPPSACLGAPGPRSKLSPGASCHRLFHDRGGPGYQVLAHSVGIVTAEACDSADRKGSRAAYQPAEVAAAAPQIPVLAVAVQELSAWCQEPTSPAIPWAYHIRDEWSYHAGADGLPSRSIDNKRLVVSLATGQRTKRAAMAARQMPTAISELPLQKVRQGKVRDVYAVDPDRLLLVATDRISAFDVVMNEPIPFKGQVLTQLKIGRAHV